MNSTLYSKLLMYHHTYFLSPWYSDMFFLQEKRGATPLCHFCHPTRDPLAGNLIPFLPSSSGFHVLSQESTCLLDDSHAPFVLSSSQTCMCCSHTGLHSQYPASHSVKDIQLLTETSENEGIGIFLKVQACGRHPIWAMYSTINQAILDLLFFFLYASKHPIILIYVWSIILWLLHFLRSFI